MESMIRGWVATSMLLFGSALAASDGHPLTATDDWERAAQLAKQTQVPLLLVFTADDCGYCERLKQAVLEPMLAQGAFADRALVREVNISRGGKITDFDGERIRSRLFKDRYQVFAAPTVVLVDAKGRPLVPSIVGFDQAEDYRLRLQRILNRAHTALLSREKPRIAGVNAP